MQISLFLLILVKTVNFVELLCGLLKHMACVLIHQLSWLPGLSALFLSVGLNERKSANWGVSELTQKPFLICLRCPLTIFKAFCLVYNAFSQFGPKVKLYSQLQLSLWSDPIALGVLTQNSEC